MNRNYIRSGKRTVRTDNEPFELMHMTPLQQIRVSECARTHTHAHTRQGIFYNQEIQPLLKV